MKNLLLGVMCVMSFNNFAQDAGVGDRAENFRRNLSQRINGIESEMLLNVYNRKLEFPDYEIAANNLLEKIDQSKRQFDLYLDKVEEFLSWHQQIKDDLALNPNNKALQNLLAKKNEELSDMKDVYARPALDLITLNSHLTTPVSISPRPGKYIPGMLLLATPVLMMPFTAGVSLFTGAPFYIAGAAFYMVDETEVNAGKFFIAGAIKDSTGEVIYNANQGDFTAVQMKKMLLGDSVKRIFSECKTQGCVYYIAEDLKKWIEASSEVVNKLDINDKKIKAFKFSLPLPKRKYLKSIDQMADIAAKGKLVSY
jgi:hypothetical protein